MEDNKVTLSSSNSLMDVVTETNNMSADEQAKLEQLQAARQAAIGSNPNIQQLLRARKTRPIVRDYKKISRNAPCPCGSGKKYKNCCLSTGEYEGTHTV